MAAGADALNWCDPLGGWKDRRGRKRVFKVWGRRQTERRQCLQQRRAHDIKERGWMALKVSREMTGGCDAAEMWNSAGGWMLAGVRIKVPMKSVLSTFVLHMTYFDHLAKKKAPRVTF